MSSHTNTRNNKMPAEQLAQKATTNRWMIRLARFGYATKGIVYLIIGGLATQLALGDGGSTTDQRGALHTIYSQPFGTFLLSLVAIGLIGFSIWSFLQAIFDTEAKGHDAKGIIARFGYALVGISYGALAFGAYQLATTGDAGKSSTSTTQDWTALLLSHSIGVAVVVLVGLGIIASALYLFWKASSAEFRSQLNLATVSAQVSKWVIFIGRCGYSALGVVLSIIGLFLIVAAFQRDPHEAKGLDSALQVLLHQPLGPVLLGIVALGLVAYGIFSFTQARYRRVGNS